MRETLLKTGFEPMTLRLGDQSSYSQKESSQLLAESQIEQ
jgi:hypothetical protein